MMWVLYADETNLDPKQSTFFVYGGVAFNGEKLPAFHLEVSKLRESLKVKATELVKFNPGPEELSHESFIQLKQGYLEAAARHGGQMIVDVVHHKIIKAGDVAAARRMAINRICMTYNGLLMAAGSHGIILLDRFNDPKIDDHLREKAAIGLKGLPYSESLPLNRVLGIHTSAIGQAHACSLVDIAVGSLRFAINAHCKGEDGKLESAKKMLALLGPLFRRGLNGKVNEDFHLSPQVVKAAEYRQDYQRLKEFLDAAGIPIGQEITDQRSY